MRKTKWPPNDILDVAQPIGEVHMHGLRGITDEDRAVAVHTSCRLTVQNAETSNGLEIATS